MARARPKKSSCPKFPLFKIRRIRGFSTGTITGTPGATLSPIQ